MNYPFGRSKGTALTDCDDKDLEYLVKYYTSPDKDGKSRLTGKYGANNQAMLNEAQQILNGRTKPARPAGVRYAYDEVPGTPMTKEFIGMTVVEILDRVKHIENVLGIIKPQPSGDPEDM